MNNLVRNRQYYKFSLYGFLKNLRFFEAFFILFLVEKGMSYTQIGILYAVREISTNVLEIPSGIVADTYGRKKSLMGSLVAYIVSFVVFYLSGNFWLFFLAFVLYGTGDAFRTGTHKGMIMDYLRLNGWEEQKITYYGHTRSWSQKGSALSSLIAGVIVFYSGSYQHIFLYSIVPYLLNFFLIFSYPSEINRSEHRESAEGRRQFMFMVKSLIQIIRKPNVLGIVNTTALHSAYLQAIKDYIQPVMASVALLIPVWIHTDTEKRNGVIIGVLYFFIYLASSYASKLSARVATKNKTHIAHFTLLAGFLFGLISGLFYMITWQLMALIAFIGIYLVENIRKPFLTGFIADHVPYENLVSVISAQSLLKTLITAVIAFVAGFIADRFGIGTAIMVVSLLLLLLSSGVVLATKKNQKDNLKS
jgi:MFS family permease